jgi:hypothetical protein
MKKTTLPPFIIEAGGVQPIEILSSVFSPGVPSENIGPELNVLESRWVQPERLLVSNQAWEFLWCNGAFSDALLSKAEAIAHRMLNSGKRTAVNKVIKKAIEQAKLPWGMGWTSLTPNMRAALVQANVLGQFAAIDVEDIGVERRAEMFVEWQAIADMALQGDF